MKHLNELTPKDKLRLFNPFALATPDTARYFDSGPAELREEVIAHPQQEFGEYENADGDLIIWRQRVVEDMDGHHDLIFYVVNPE